MVDFGPFPLSPLSFEDVAVEAAFLAERLKQILTDAKEKHFELDFDYYAGNWFIVLCMKPIIRNNRYYAFHINDVSKAIRDLQPKGMLLELMYKRATQNKKVAIDFYLQNKLRLGFGNFIPLLNDKEMELLDMVVELDVPDKPTLTTGSG